MASLALYQASLLQINKGPSLNFSSLFLFSSAFFTYNILQSLGSKKVFNKLSFSMMILLGVSIALCVYSLFFLDYTTIVLFLAAGLFTFFYTFPIHFNSRNYKSLRNFWFLKSIIVALVWTISCSFIPLLENQVCDSKLYWFSIEKFLFILGITLPYDIKDLSIDKQQIGMQSFAMKFGLKKTIYISNLLLLVACILAWNLYNDFQIPMLLVYFSAVLINIFTHEKRSNYWFTLVVDGLILAYFFLLFIAKHVF